jgi:hypothetical protein
MRYVTIFALLVGMSARADAPSVELVRKLCVDGELRGIVIKVAEPGVYGIRWGADVCRGET